MWKQLVLAAALTAALAAAAAPKAATAPLACPKQCQCADERPQECPQQRSLVARPDCFQCCVVCARVAGEECGGSPEAVCDAHLHCVDNKCKELPRLLWPSSEPIEILHVAPINSDGVEIFIRIPDGAAEVAKSIEIQQYAVPTSPRNRVKITRKSPAWDERTFVVQVEGLKWKELYLTVVAGEFRSPGFKVNLNEKLPTMRKLLFAEPDEEETNKPEATPCMYEGKAFNPGEAYLSTNCSERCECDGKGIFKCEPTNDETSSACSKVTDIGAEMLSVVDSTNDTLTVRWRGHQGMILQYREEGTNDPWQRTDRLTPDGTQEPATIVISNLNSVTTYEVRTLLPGQEEGRSARGEDLPTKGTTKPLNEHQESGFCVVLGKKIPSGEEIPSGSGTCSEQKCICQPGQPPMCRQRCSVPFFRRGAFSQDDLCTEKPSPEDACCVILQCTDQDAEGTGTDPCDQCSENTDCHKAAVQTDEALCMCKEGFVGDPYDKKSGCKPTAPLLATKELKKCFYKNNSYSMGQLFYDGCKQKCTCNNQAEIQCEPRCPKISEKMSEGCQMVTNPEDVCCKMIKCDDKSEKLTTGVTYTEQGTPVKGCVYKEKLYKKGQTFVDGCEKNCTCSQNGDVICKARCSPLEPNPSDKCVTVPDPSDICCTKILCDVGEESNESRNPPSSIEAEDAEVKGIDIDGVKAFNSSSARLIAHLPGNMTWQQGIPELAVFYTKDPNGHWSKAPVISTNPGVKSDLEIYASGLPSGKIYLRVENGALKSKDFSITLPDSPTGSTPGKECDHNGKIYKLNEEFHNGCEEYCACTKTGIQCATIECPTDFALDVLDPYCLDWEKEPGFVAVPPRCCPDMICKSNGTCHYKGESFDNYAEIPTKITGCEQRCYCEFGNVTCSPACPPVPATPPLTIGCDPSEARLSHLPGEDCCLYWLCPQPQGAGQKPPLGDAKGHDENDTTKQTETANFMPTPVPDEPSTKTKDNKNSKSKTPLVLNPDLQTKKPTSSLEPIDPSVPPTPFTPPKTKTTEPFLGPYAPDYKESPFSFHGEPVEHGYINRPPAGGGKAPVQKQQPHIDPHFLEDLLKGNWNQGQQPPPLRGHPDENRQTVVGQIPPHLLQTVNRNPQGAPLPVDSAGRPILSPIAAHIEQHFQNHPGRPQGHPGHPGHLNEAPPNDYDEHYILQNGQLIPFNPAQFQPQDPQGARRPPQNFGGHVLVSRNDTQFTDPDALSSNSHEKTPDKANAPSNLPFPSVNTNEITLLPPMPLGPRAVRLIFQVPRVYIGLNGKVEVRYTDGSRDINDPSKWERAMTETDELIDGVQMAHEVSGLKPNTEYHFQIAIHVRELGSMVSHVAIVRTPHDVASAGPQVIPVDAGLAVSQVNATWIKVSWRKFSEDELQFIDGVQIRYRERGSQLFQSTPLIHRLVDSYLLEDLNPGTEYEINIIFVPFLGQDTELQAMRSVQATTGPPQADPYGFDLAVHVAMVKANSVELSWTGVPNPEDKYVNIFRAIYQSDVEANKHELSSTFKLAKRDSVSNRTRTVIQALKPNTRYRIWLEAYLTNGKVKRSDVRTFTTKPGLLPSAGASERVAEEPRGDYYGALVGVSVFAALAVVALVILMMIMVRRQHSVTANITSRGKSEAAFDNPSFKNSDEPAVVTNGSSKRTAQEDA
ncbi:putative epidermal cell surface receptor isoform X1 [Neocloeon triangulifer]|uniref:putative epidermal cell surface receptor isoform X1 n=1 Tax=Neocloeon triangulifer TaxID=2078957 RepID=UPI00286F61FE|nr:putative epidermal cell surface receptor isoform X1 [Neocloeon triangulifer]